MPERMCIDSSDRQSQKQRPGSSVRVLPYSNDCTLDFVQAHELMKSTLSGKQIDLKSEASKAAYPIHLSPSLNSISEERLP